tara:strand:+ start:3522 stop:3905 length:384 start_codon:yes stop_codon:yes gene_type:complete
MTDNNKKDIRTKRGGFAKGNSMGGRTKGAANKLNRKTKEVLAQLLEDNIEDVQADIDSLEPKDRLNFLMHLASFVVPKLKSVEVSGDITNQSVLGLNSEEIIELEAEITTITNEDSNNPESVKQIKQ